MSDKIQVELLERIANKGKAGDIIEVSRAEARNFLIPKGLARELTPARLAEIETKRKKQGDTSRMIAEEIYTLRDQLHGQTISFTLAGNDKKIFGGIGEKEIIDALAKKYGIALEKKHIKLPTGHKLKEVGTHDVVLNLGREVFVKMHIEILAKS